MIIKRNNNQTSDNQQGLTTTAMILEILTCGHQYIYTLMTVLRGLRRVRCAF